MNTYVGYLSYSNRHADLLFELISRRYQHKSTVVPTHWSPEQALAVLESLQAVRAAVWAAYGQQSQQAWRDQLVPDRGPPDFDPDLPL